MTAERKMKLINSFSLNFRRNQGLWRSSFNLVIPFPVDIAWNYWVTNILVLLLH